MNFSFVLWGYGVVFTLMIIIFLFIVFWLRWNIPVTILRYTGNKGRPLMFHTKARKVMKQGVPRLIVKKYDLPIRDYLAENYYPTIRGKWGGLILWEVEDGVLTPALPKRSLIDKLKGEGKLTPEQQEVYEQAQALFKAKGVKFEFDEQLFKDIKLKIVDDVDIDFMLEEISRRKSQYNNWFAEFMNRHGSMVMIVFICMLLFAGFVVGLEKLPDLMAQCSAAGADVVKGSLLEQAANTVRPPA